MNDLLEFISIVIKHSDPYGKEHGGRVSKLSTRLLDQLGVTDTQIRYDVKIAGLIHDVGKFRVPESIRRQNGEYLPAEFDAMKCHAVYGAELLEPITNGTISPGVVQIVKHHHEDFGGTGYPDGLHGTDIPYGARVLRIVDTYDAMTHDRGYRKAFDTVSCLQEMVDFQIKNMVFDPKLFRAFLEMMGAKGKRN